MLECLSSTIYSVPHKIMRSESMSIMKKENLFMQCIYVMLMVMIITYLHNTILVPSVTGCTSLCFLLFPQLHTKVHPSQ